MNIEELKGLCEKATPGKWKYAEPEGRITRYQIWANGERSFNTWVATIMCGEAPREQEANARLIVAARTALPLLVEMWEAVKQGHGCGGRSWCAMCAALKKLEAVE